MHDAHDAPADDDFVSKTRRKKEMHALQELGERLVSLSRDRLESLHLPERLQDAVLEARRITSHGARKRQMQYIGKLMRDVDPAPIQARFDAWDGKSHAEAARFHALERWRERLLKDEKALQEFAGEFPHADLQVIRTLIRNARKEQAENKPPRNFRALFRELRVVVLGEAEDEDGTDEPEGDED